MISLEVSPAARLKQVSSFTLPEKQAVLDHITAGVPIKPWPYGMPSSATPHVVILGVSPGNSPQANDRGMNTYRAIGDLPAFGKAPNFLYEDRTKYWNKVRDLCAFLVRRDSPKLSDAEALTLGSHLNLGTRQMGVAGLGAVEDDITKWVSSLLYSKFQAKVLVCFGLVGILPQKNDIWNSGGLVLDWSKPADKESFGRNSFRLWHATRKDGKRMAVLGWPNHPSKPPFAGSSKSPHWIEAKKCADKFLRRHGY